MDEAVEGDADLLRLVRVARRGRGTIVFTSFGVALSLAHDRRDQVVDRFRSLPIAKGAVLSGHAVAELVKALLPIVLASLCGLIVGWRINSNPLDAMGGYLLLFGFAFAMIWVGVLLGSVVRTPEGVQGIGFGVLFPLTFLVACGLFVTPPAVWARAFAYT